MVAQIRLALLVLLIGASAIVAWNYIEQTDRAHQSNVPGVDPNNPLAEYGVESAEHQAYVEARVRNARYRAIEAETAIITVVVVLGLLAPIVVKERSAA
jgi:lipopolysaccharide export system protein LptC